MKRIKYYVWLQTALGFHNIRIIDIINNFASAEEIYKLKSKERRACGLFTEKELFQLENTDLSAAELILEDCKNSKIEIIAYGDENYPLCLSYISNPPFLLYVKGKMPNFDEIPAISIIGPRKVSEYGKKSAYSLAYRLAKSGFTVVSCGSVGSDYYAHIGALKAKGITALVMPCGINNNYPAQNTELRRAVAECGCLISEYSPRCSVTKYSFAMRNRIVSALSLGTILIEASKKSGTLSAVNSAIEQGRDVFVIPGSPSDKRYEGSNALLRDGAKPLLDLSDIFNEYITRFSDKISIESAYEKIKKDSEKNLNKKILNETLSKEAKIVYNHLDKHEFYPDEIKNTDLSSGEILSALTELEIEFLIKSLPGGRYKLCD